MEHRRLIISIIITLLLGTTIIVECPRFWREVKATSNRVFYTSDDDYVYITQQDLAIKIRFTRRNYRSGGEIESLTYKGSADLVAADPLFGFVYPYNVNGTLLAGEYVGGTSLIAATGNNTGKLDLVFQSTVINDATNGTVLPVNTTIQYTVYSDIDDIFVNVTLASNQTTWIFGYADYGSSLNFNTFSSYNATGFQYHNCTGGNLVQGGTIPINASPDYNILTIMNTTSNLAVTLFPTNLLMESGTIKDDASSTRMYLQTTETSTYDIRNGGTRLYGSNWGSGITYSVCFAFSDTGNPFVVVPWTMPNATPFGLFGTYDDLPSSREDYLYYPPNPNATNQDAWLAWLNNGTARRTTLMLLYDQLTGTGTPNADGEDGSWLLHGTIRLANMTSDHKAWMVSVEGGQLGFQTHAYHHDYPWKWEFSSITNSTWIDVTFNQMWLDAQTLGMGNNTFKFFKAAGFNAEPQILDVMTKYGIQQYDRNLDTAVVPICSFYISNSGDRLILTSDVCDISDSINNGFSYSQLASDLQGNLTTLNFVSIHGHFPNSTTNWGMFNDVFASVELTYGENLDYFLVPEITSYLNVLWSNSYTFNSTTITSSNADSRLTYCLLNRPASFSITSSLAYTGTTPFARDLYSPNIATGGYRFTRLTGYANLTNVVSGLQTLNFTITKPAAEPAILTVSSVPQPVRIIGATGLYNSTTSTLTITVPAGSASTDVFVDWSNQSVKAGTIVVPDDYPTIQEAINAANEGDTVFVRSGTYPENVVLNRSVSLVGENESSTAITGAPDVIGVPGLKVQNTSGLIVSSFSILVYNSVGLEISASSNITFTNCTIGGDRAGAMHTPLIPYAVIQDSQNMTIAYCTCGYGAGFAMVFEDSSNNTIRDSELAGSRAVVVMNGSNQNVICRNRIHGAAIEGYPCDEVIALGNSAGNTFYENSMDAEIASRDELFPLIPLLSLSNSSFNCFYHNFMKTITRDNINIVIPGQISGNSTSNRWDDSYPSGGNYWSDYNGTDLFSGPYQNISGSDGVGDTPYVINQQNLDNYPLMIESPVADFTYSPLTPIVNETVTFDASISKNGWNGTQSIPIIAYAWDFGDNNTAIGQVVTHAYADSGDHAARASYTVTLNVTDNQGLWNFTQKLIQIGQPYGPVAGFTTDPETGHVGEAMDFNASSSIEGWNGTNAVPIIEYLWNFGDENYTYTSTDNSMVAHVFASQGTFNVMLAISDAEGGHSKWFANVSVVMPTFVSVATISTSVLGSAVGLNGTLQDTYGNCLKGESVVLSYTFAGANSWYPISSDVTNSLGNYYVQWSPPATGYFTIKAEWAGNTTYLGAYSTVALSILPYENQYVFTVESNSTISDLTYDSNSHRLSFVAEGENGTTGYTKVTIAKSLGPDITLLKVHLDNTEYNYAVTNMTDSWLLFFTYNHSIHQIEIDLGQNPIPEFSSFLAIALFMIGTVLAVINYKKKRSRALRYLT